MKRYIVPTITIAKNSYYILLNKRNRCLKFFFFSLISVIIILIVQKQVYWRPYNDTLQESLASFHAHGFALANFAGLGKNPFVARDIDVKEAKIHVYNHWPNSFFLILGIAIKIFGNTEMVGRSVAISLTLTGLYLLAFAFRGKNGLSFLGVPLLLITPIGKAAIPFVFIDASFIFWIGFLSAVISLHGTRTRVYNCLFRFGIILSHFFIHLIFPFAFFGAIARFLQHKNVKELTIDLLFVLISFTGIIVFLSWTDNGFRDGFNELLLQFLHRSNISLRYSENVTFIQLFLTLSRHLIYNMGILSIFLPFTYFYIFIKKNPALFLLPTAIVYSIIMRNYAGVHVFANLPFISIAWMSFLLGLELFVGDVLCRNNFKKNFIKVMFLLLFITLLPINILLMIKPIIFRSIFSKTYYSTDKQIEQERNLYLKIKDKIDSSSYNAFMVKDDEDRRTIQFYAGERVIKGIINKEKKKSAYIDLNKGVIVPVD